MAATCLPSSAARSRTMATGLVGLSLYKATLMARTLGSLPHAV